MTLKSDPHLVKDRQMLENVQKFGCRLATHQWDTSYHELLELFELQPLEQRRLHLKLRLMFKNIHRFCYFPSIPAIRDNMPSLSMDLHAPSTVYVCCEFWKELPHICVISCRHHYIIFYIIITHIYRLLLGTTEVTTAHFTHVKKSIIWKLLRSTWP